MFKEHNNISAVIIENEMDENRVDEITEIEVIEEKEDDNVEIIQTNVSGIVSNCKKLNLREDCSTEANIVSVLDEFEELIIQDYVEDSESEWYRVRTKSGEDGFCMSKFIEIMK